MPTATTTPAAIAQRIRAEILTWPDVHACHGPSLGRKDHFFYRIEMMDGSAYALELARASTPN